jgi:dipeptidyl aminopeptidase/acylaminoacyl peptidase
MAPEGTGSLDRMLDALDGLRGPSDLCWSPDGDAVLATVAPASYAKGEGYRTRIWRFPVQGEPSRVTDAAGPGSDTQPQVSPDGRRLAFLSDRAELGRMALFVREGDADRPLGHIPGSVEAFAWVDVGRALLALAADEGLDAGATEGAVRYAWGPEADPEITTGGPRRRLFRIDAASGATAEVGASDVSVWEFDVIDDQTVIAVVSADPGERGWYHTRLARIALGSPGIADTLHASPWQLQSPVVDPSRTRVAFLEGWSSDRGLLAGDVRLLDLRTGAVEPISPAGLSNISSLQWRDPDSLWFAGWADTGAIYGVMRLDGTLAWSRRDNAVIGPSSFLAKVTPSPDGERLAIVRDAVGAPPEIVVGSASEAPGTAITVLNGATAASVADIYPEIRPLHWEGAGGLPMQGFVLLPRDRGPGPLPTVVDIHGGPTWSVKHAYNTGFALPYAAAGFAVFLPNYRGNIGWGQPFARLNIGDPGGAEFQDILLGIDSCVAAGFADPARLGVTGASYGGYLTAWAVATTDRFKAAVMVSGISDQVSCHYSANHDYCEGIMGGPLTDPVRFALAVERSPMTRLDRPTTPTLILHGREDRCTPVGQAHQFYAGLRERGCPAELVIYPREGHGNRERAHIADAWRRKIAWFDKHLRSGA